MPASKWVKNTPTHKHTHKKALLCSHNAFHYNCPLDNLPLLQDQDQNGVKRNHTYCFKEIDNCTYSLEYLPISKNELPCILLQLSQVFVILEYSEVMAEGLEAFPR